MGGWRRRDWITAAAVCAVLGLVSAWQSYVIGSERGEDETFALQLFTRFLPWQSWLVIVPVAFAIRRGFAGGGARRAAASVPLHLVMCALGTLVVQALIYECGRAAGIAPFAEYTRADMLPPMTRKNLPFTALLYTCVLVVDAAVELRRRVRAEADARARLETQLAAAQLHALEAQLHPHFLFNTLNSIAVLIKLGDAARAGAMVTELAALLRRSLRRSDAPLVTVAEEVEFLERYLAIEAIRFSDRMVVEIHVEPAVAGAAVPAFLLQPIVENAIKHGLAPRADRGHLAIDVRGADGRLRAEIRDDGVGVGTGAAAPADGVGLTLVRSRLAQLYPGAHRFTLEPAAPRGTIATVELPLAPLAASEAA
jgi:two-component system, LytTR family, sensor kinase